MQKKKLNLSHVHCEFASQINDERMSNQTVNVSLMFSDHFPFNFAVNPN